MLHVRIWRETLKTKAAQLFVSLWLPMLTERNEEEPGSLGLCWSQRLLIPAVTWFFFLRKSFTFGRQSSVCPRDRCLLKTWTPASSPQTVNKNLNPCPCRWVWSTCSTWSLEPALWRCRGPSPPPAGWWACRSSASWDSWGKRGGGWFWGKTPNLRPESSTQTTLNFAPWLYWEQKVPRCHVIHVRVQTPSGSDDSWNTAGSGSCSDWLMTAFSQVELRLPSN